MQSAAVPGGRHHAQGHLLTKDRPRHLIRNSHFHIWPPAYSACVGQRVLRGHGSGTLRGGTSCFAIGPEPYDVAGQAKGRTRKPEWVRILEEDADNDPEVARLLEGTDGDPDRIRDKMRFALKETDMRREREGSDVPPQIRFRAISPMGLWVWVEFLEAPLSGEQELLEGLLKSWFAVGKLGGYNSQNLQVYQNADDDQSFFEYDNDELEVGENRMASYIHDIGEVEYRDKWARVWIDMGTADELSLDILINMLVGFSAEMCGLKSILLGGANEDWPLPPEEREFGPDADYMKVGMDPMRLPEGLDEEFQFMDDEGMLEGGKGRRVAGAAAGARGGDMDAYDIDDSGYNVRAGSFGARAEEQELQRLAERLRRPARAGSSGGGGAGAAARGGGGTRGYYGGTQDLDQALGPDFNPDELEFIDGEEEPEGSSGGSAGGGASGGGGQAQATEAKRPWGASFVRRVKRGPGAGAGSS